MPHQTITLAIADEPDRSASVAGRRLDRRTVIRTAGVLGAGAAGAGLLAACGSSSDPSSASAVATTSSAAPTTSPATTTETTTSSAATGSETAAAAAPSGTPVKTSDVPVGGGTILPDQKIVVTQPASGTFKAFSAVCTHMGCTVNQVEAGFIDCPCHQSQFDISTGSPTSSSQATQPLPAKTATVSGDSVYVS